MPELNSKAADWIWKVFTLALGVLIMPLAGWVWQTNLSVSDLQNDLDDIEVQMSDVEETLEELEEHTLTLVGVERDVQHIREILNRIEGLVSKGGKK